LEKLNARLGIGRLRDFIKMDRVPSSRAAGMADAALASGSPQNIRLSPRSMKYRLYRQAW